MNQKTIITVLASICLAGVVFAGNIWTVPFTPTSLELFNVTANSNGTGPYRPMVYIHGNTSCDPLAFYADDVAGIEMLAQCKRAINTSAKIQILWATDVGPNYTFQNLYTMVATGVGAPKKVIAISPVK